MAENIYDAIDLFSAIPYMAGYLITALAFLSAVDHIHRSLESREPAPAQSAAD